MTSPAYYSVIHRPATDVSGVSAIDAKYDPYHGLVGPHITLVFPIPVTDVKKEDLFSHVKAIATNTNSFKVRINDTELSWDQWLFLVPTIGYKKLT
jgi:hypothetical protein